MTRFISILFILFGSISISADPVIVSPEKVSSGEFLSLIVYSNFDVGKLDLSLKTENGSIIVRHTGFQVFDGHKREIWAVVIGIPVDVISGVYFLELDGEDSSGTFQSKQSIYVDSREYRYEEISLNSDMSDLRTSDDPQKRIESRVLWQLLTSFDPSSIYHSGNFSSPLTDSVETSFFGDSRMYLYADGGTERAKHMGLDLAAPVGTPVFACGAGKIVFADSRIITGNTVVIEHLPGVYSLYYHLDELNTEYGEIVESGQQIGKVGATGLVTGAHLHWEIRVGAVPVDPDFAKGNDLLDKNLIIGKIGLY